MSAFLLALPIVQATSAAPSGDPAQPAPACAAIDQSLPAELAGWTSTGERLTSGNAVTLQGVQEPTPPGGHPGLGATIAFSVPMNGVYGIALDQAGWIEVQPVMDQGPARPLRSVGHEHAPACSTIHKIVRFELNAGTYYSLSLSGLQNPTARAMLVAPPPPAPPAQ